jgi:hypothetical protein
MGTVLKLKKAYPKGGASYGIDGVRGSIYVNKSILAGDPPAEFEVATDGVFAPPGSGVARVDDPERIAKMTEAAAKADIRAQKAAERAAKLRQRLEKAGQATPASGEVETATT